MEAAPSPWRRLGRVLVEGGLITEDQLDAALENQVRTRRLLGDIVVELGYVSAENVERALAFQAARADPERAFGTGLRSELERRAGDQPAPPASVHLVPEPPADVPVESGPGHVLMVQLPARYVLVEREGAVPPPSATLELPEVGPGTFRIESIGRSPFPDDARACAFALRVHDPAA